MNDGGSTVFGTVSGRRVDLRTPDWREIVLDDLARGLSQTRRFGGQSRRPFTVAEHSLVVAQLAPSRLRLAALLHDAHEALMGDLLTPTAKALEAALGLRFEDELHRLKFRLDVAVARSILEAFVPDLVAPDGEVLASHLACEMNDHRVVSADAEAFRLENAIRKEGALQHGTSPTISRALELYGVLAPHEATIGATWRAAVIDAASGYASFPKG